MYIRRFSIPDAEYLRREIKEELAGLEDDQDLHLYYSLMEFRHNLMLEYLEPLESRRMKNNRDYRICSRILIKSRPGWPDVLIIILIFSGDVWAGMPWISFSDSVFKKAEYKLDFVKDCIEKAEFYFKMSESYYYMKQTYFSMDYARQAYKIYHKQEAYNIRVLQCHSLFATNFLDLKQYDEAIQHFKRLMPWQRQNSKISINGPDSI